MGYSLEKSESLHNDRKLVVKYDNIVVVVFAVEDNQQLCCCAGGHGDEMWR